MSLTLPSCFFPEVGEFFPGEGGVAPAELFLDRCAARSARHLSEYYNTLVLHSGLASGPVPGIMIISEQRVLIGMILRRIQNLNN